MDARRWRQLGAALPLLTFEHQQLGSADWRTAVLAWVRPVNGHNDAAGEKKNARVRERVCVRVCVCARVLASTTTVDREAVTAAFWHSFPSFFSFLDAPHVVVVLACPIQRSLSAWPSRGLLPPLV